MYKPGEYTSIGVYYKSNYSTSVFTWITSIIVAKSLIAKIEMYVYICSVFTSDQTARQYKLFNTISNSTEVYEEPVTRTEKIPHYAVTFEAGEENKIVYESLYWKTNN